MWAVTALSSDTEWSFQGSSPARATGSNSDVQPLPAASSTIVLAKRRYHQLARSWPVLKQIAEVGWNQFAIVVNANERVVPGS